MTATETEVEVGFEILDEWGHVYCVYCWPGGHVPGKIVTAACGVKILLQAGGECGRPGCMGECQVSCEKCIKIAMTGICPVCGAI